MTKLLFRLFALCCTIISCAAESLDSGIQVYDYVIIGGGGAGLVMANRLSEDRTKTVLVLVRGADWPCNTCDNTTTVSYAGGSIMGDGLYAANGANYFSTPSLFPGRSIREIRTNLPGGNTRLYSGVAIPASKSLIDRKWPISYNTLRPYFNKYQDHFCHYLPVNQTGISSTDCAFYHGQPGGPMSVSPPTTGADFDVAKDFFAAGNQFNVRKIEDPFNVQQQVGGDFMFPQATFQDRAVKNDIKSRKTRESTYTGYTPQSLRDRRPNLDFAWQSEGRQLIYSSDLNLFPGIARTLGLTLNGGTINEKKKTRVIGVKYFVAGDDMKIVFARKHVVLSGGVEGSVKFLQHNGIGPADLLKKNGITVVANNPAIGQNVQTHEAVSMVFKTKNGLPPSPNNGGQLVIMQLFSPTNKGWADIEVEVTFGTIVKSFDLAVTGTDPLYYTAVTPQGVPFVSAFVVVTDPTNKGSINITSDRFEDPSQVNYGWPSGFADYASSPDFNKLRWAFGKMRQVFLGNNTFSSKYVQNENAPGTAPDATSQATTDLFYSAYNQHSVYHSTGGVNLGIATDNNGLVNGVSGLTVCDNSLIPYSPNANPTATTLALCEYVADKIKSYDE